jgi:ubiquinone/menaquinone biosynthesis C-methylase UbiE
MGSIYFHNLIERFWVNKSATKILEVGAGMGEHLPFLKNSTLTGIGSYSLLDIREQPNQFSEFLTLLHEKNPNFLPGKFSWVKGSVETIPLPDNSMDRIVSTCLFAHLDDPLKAFQEVRRVVKAGGEICIGLPTDPGILNRIVKGLVTYPKAQKIGLEFPQLVYALEHRNAIGGLLNMAKVIYRNDKTSVHFRPFGIPSWNLNLAAIVHVKKNED